MGSLTAPFKDLLSKDTLTIAGGAVLGGLVSSWLMSKYGPYSVSNGVLVPNTGFKLPGSDTKYGPLAYSVVIPVGLAIAVRKFSPRLSQGLIYGGAVMLIQQVINTVQGFSGATVAAAPTTGTGAYLTRGTIKAIPGTPPGYSAVRAFGGALDNTSAFRSAWSISR